MLSFKSMADYSQITSKFLIYFHLVVLVKFQNQHVKTKHLLQQICSSSYVPSPCFQEPELKKIIFETITPKFVNLRNILVLTVTELI
jgi:hypothetical protein